MNYFEKIFWYYQEFAEIIFYSLFYFIGLTCAGYFFILRRSVFLGMLLSKLAQLSFILGLSFVSFLSWPEDNISFWILDFLVLCIFFLGIFTLHLLEIRYKKNKNIEILFACLFVFCSGAIHLGPKFFTIGEPIFAKSYFTEILYTPPKILKNYLVVFIPTLLLFLLYFKRFFWLSFDKEHEQLMGKNTRAYEILLYFFIGIFLSFSLKVLGFYLSLLGLFIPSYLALLLFNHPWQSLLWSFVFTILFSLFGFFFSFLFDSYPTEAVFICSICIQAGFVYLLVYLRRVFC